MVNKYAIVTGAATGIGFEFSKLLAIDGYNLVLVDVDSKKLKAGCDYLKENMAVEAVPVKLDLSKPGSAQVIYDQVKDKEISILINNAGHGLWGAFTDTDWKYEDSMINLHVLTSTHLTKLIVKDMIKAGEGRIMNVSSVAALNPGPMMAVYYASKAYLLSFGEAVANELKATGVSLTTFCPGLVRTEFASTVSNNSKVPEMQASFMSDKADRIAKKGYRAMMKGKAVYIPLLKNKVLGFASWLLPRSWAVRIIRMMQDRIH